MFDTISIKNFRCIDALELTQLARVNLIAGRNNSGKTAVLEAIRLHCDPTDSLLPTKINESRKVGDSTTMFEELWSWFFRDKNTGNKIELGSTDRNGDSHKAIYRFLDTSAAQLEFPDKEKMVAELPNQGWYPAQKRLIVRYEGPPANRTIGIMGGHGQAWYTPVPPWNVACVMVTSGLPQSDMEVEYFSKLETERRQSELLSGLRILEPKLRRLALVVISHKTIVHGEIDGLTRLVPAFLMGEGVRRLLGILLALANSNGGVLLIDEIENGFHHSVLKQVWQAIAAAAKQNNVQVFATTHSYECIQAAHAAFVETKPYDLKLFRLERRDSAIRAIAFNQATLDTSVDMNLEVR